MDTAINKITNTLVSAFKVYEDGSYQNLTKGEWIAPVDKITNWDELEKLNIKEERVHYVHMSEITYKSGKVGLRAPHFSVYPGSMAKTVAESPEHKKIKNWLFEKLKKDDLVLIYSKGTKPWRFNNYVKLSELCIDWNNYQIPEEIIKGTHKKLRADILLPFLKKHDFLGHGIKFEIQLSKQNEEKTWDRTIDGALQGYSTCWIMKDDYEEEDENISLIKNELTVYSWACELKYNKKQFMGELDRDIEKQLQYLDKKSYEIINMFNNLNQSILNSLSNLTQIQNQLYIDTKKQIDGYFSAKTNELSLNLGEKVAERIQKNFYKNNIEEIGPLIDQAIISHFENIEIHNLSKEVKTNIEKRTESMIKIAENMAREEINRKLTSYDMWRKFYDNPIKCKNCGSYTQLRDGQYGPWLKCPNCSEKQPPIPQKIKDVLKDVM